MKNKLPIKWICWYQREISAKRTTPRCKHVPSCSNYALGCYEKFNFFTASFYTTKRILKCNRFSKGKYDPVPLTKSEKRIQMATLKKEDTEK